MKLIKFNFLTLILSALITFNVGVAGSLCTPDNDEFDDRITNQDSTDPELQVEDIPTTDEIGTTASENIASTAAETTGALEAPIMFNFSSSLSVGEGPKSEIILNANVQL
jgi:hypothetical protein